MTVSARKRVAFIVFFSIVYLVLLKIIVDSEWNPDRSRKIEEVRKGDTGREDVEAMGEDWKVRNTGDGEGDASVRNLSRVVKVESDGEGARPMDAGDVTVIGGDKRNMTATEVQPQGSGV